MEIKFYSKFLIIILYSVQSFFAINIRNNELIQFDSANSNWSSKVLKNLSEMEYNITYSEKLGSFQSVNKKNNLRFIYKNNGFTVSPRITDTYKNDEDNSFAERVKIKVTDDWNAVFTVLGYGRNGTIENKFLGEEFIAKGNIAFVKDENMKVDYINNQDGMRQNFIIKNRPKQEYGDLTLNMTIETNKKVTVSRDEIVITDEISEFMKYNSLKIWDAKGKILTGYLTENNSKVANGIQIVVDDNNASYPITIDPLSNSPEWTAYGEEENMQFGYSVATAGDINGDNYSDVIIGAPYYTNGEIDEGAIFVYFGSPQGLSLLPDWTVESNKEDGNLGISVSTAGDVNGDGFSDIIAGAPGYENGEISEGRIVVFHGSATGLPSTPDWSVESNQQYAFAGWSVSTAGDVNNDGYSDVIISAYQYSNGQNDEGRVLVFHGSNTGLPTSSDWSYENNIENANLGISVSTAGDVNGDGYSDVIVGIQKYLSGVDDDQAIVFHGSATGLSSSPDWSSGSNSEHEFFGFSVSTAGDVNGDGYSDVIIGAPNYSTINGASGTAYIYFGSMSGLSNTFDQQINGWMQLQNSTAYFGTSVSYAGDINGDGFADVVVGAREGTTFSPSESYEGLAYVYLGSDDGLNEYLYMEGGQTDSQFGFSVATAGDVNGDGLSDIMIGAPNYDNNLNDQGLSAVYYGSTLKDLNSQIILSENFSGAKYGYSVSTAGDINGDGFSDIVMGEPGQDNGGTGSGRIYVYLGSSDQIFEAAPIIVEGNNVLAQFGWSVATAGDVNGDGFSDIIVGAPFYSNGQSSEGKAFLYYGSSNGTLTLAWSIENNQSESYLGYCVSSAGDVNGDGYGDVIIGVPYYDGGEDNEGRAILFLGSADGLSTTPDWLIESNQVGAKMGHSVSSAGDVNGDSYSDVIIGIPDYDNGETNEGRAIVFHGSETGLSTSADWRSEGNSHEASFGSSVSTAGDVNGDGFSDIIVGSPGHNFSGSAYVYHGSVSGLSESAQWNRHEPLNFAGFGSSVSTAGDMNGDGYDDVAIGAPGFDVGGKGSIFHGSASGLSSTAFDKIGLSGDACGFSVSSAGDIDGDGFSDVLFGAKQKSEGQGGVYTFLGNDGLNRNLVTKMEQKNPGTLEIIHAGGFTGVPGQVKFRMKSKNPLGRTNGRLIYEYKPTGEAFSSDQNLANSFNSSGSGQFRDLGEFNPEGRNLTELVLDISQNSGYKWRARLEYDMIKSPYQRFGPWRYYSNYAAKLPDAFRNVVGIIIGDQKLSVDLKVYLEGAYNLSNNEMDNNLTVPSDSPYTEDVENVGTIPPTAVDWVHVELRSKDDPTLIFASKSGFILQNGSIVDTDGTSTLNFSLPADDYYISVKHRNHLQILSANPVPLTTN